MMKAKKAIISLFVGATLLAGAGIATSWEKPNVVDGATASVSFVDVNTVKAHGSVGVEADVLNQGGNQGGGSTEAKPNRLLATFQSNDTQVFRDSAYYNQTINKYTSANGYYYLDVHPMTGATTMRPGTSWDVDYKSTVTYDKTRYDNIGQRYPWYIDNRYSIYGEFVTTGMPEGSDGNGAYKFYWEERIPYLWYPSIMFGFPNTVEYEIDDELEFTLHLSEDMDQRYTLWATSALEKNVWDTAKKFTGNLIPRGKWTTISMPIKDFLRPDGTLAPIALTFAYADMASAWDTTGDRDDCDDSNDGTPPATIYFDKVEVKTVVKTLETNYRTQDLSEVVPITGEMSFTGTATTNMATFDFTKDLNIGFIREDISTNVVKLKMSITANSVFDMYFVMNGTAKYYDKGGIFYWISNEGVSIGYNGKTFASTPLPTVVKNGGTFELELRAIPYYVEGITAGYYAEMRINGTKACEGGYISSADCSFGQYFGFYMHTTKTGVTAKIAPVTQATMCPLQLTLKPKPNKTELEVDADVLIKSTLKCQMYGQSAVTFEVVDGSEYAYMDGNYLVGVAEGVATVVGKITNVFGTFTSEPLQITVFSNGNSSEDSSSDSDSSTEDSSSDVGSSDSDSSTEDSSSDVGSSDSDSSTEDSSSDVGSSDSDIATEDSSSDVDGSNEDSSSGVAFSSVVVMGCNSSLTLGILPFVLLGVGICICVKKENE